MAKLWAHVTDPPPPPSLRRPDLARPSTTWCRAPPPRIPTSATPQPRSSRPRSIGPSNEQSAKVVPGALQETRGRGATRADRARPRRVHRRAPARPARLPRPRRPPWQPVGEPDHSAAGRPARPRRPGRPARPVGRRRRGQPAGRNPRICHRAAASPCVASPSSCSPAGRGDDDGQPSSVGLLAVAATKLPPDLEWRRIASAPFRRQYAAATAVDGKLRVVGGIGVRSRAPRRRSTTRPRTPGRRGRACRSPLHHSRR